MKLKSLISTQNIFRTSEFSGWSGSKLVNFELMLNCFGPVRSGENIIGSVRGQGHKIYYFSVRSGSGQKITGQYGVGVAKTLPRRTLIRTMEPVMLHVRTQSLCDLNGKFLSKFWWWSSLASYRKLFGYFRLLWFIPHTQFDIELISILFLVFVNKSCYFLHCLAVIS